MVLKQINPDSLTGLLGTKNCWHSYDYILEVARSLQKKIPLCSENLHEVTWNQNSGKGEQGEEKKRSHSKPQKAQRS